MKQFAAAMVAVVAMSGWNSAEAQQGSAVRTPGQGLQSGQTTQAQTLRNNRTFGATRADSQQGPTVTQALVKKMHKANDAEIELAKIAKENTDNDDVRQLAKTIIDDHQSLNQKLQEMESGHSDNQNSRNRSGDNRAVGQADRSSGQRNRDAMGDEQSARVPEQLCKIVEQACQNSLDMTKEMLHSKKGQNFNMAYLGQQIVAHTMVLAELNAIQSSGPEELQQVVKTAIEKTKKHLEKAKEIAKRLEDKERANS